jgi:beta-phosphoglucomutase-like phosphatase (HAD superfamily)
MALDKRNAEPFRKFLPQLHPLPGAVKLLRFLRQNEVQFAIGRASYLLDRFSGFVEPAGC